MASVRAAELGPSRFPWWQDWRGECAAIVASGPSTKSVNVAALRDRIHVIAIKENWKLCPWADVVYGCDAPWWLWRKGLVDYEGLKLTQALKVSSTYRDVYRVEVKHIHNLLVDEPGVIGSGGNSGFQALNIAVQFGATGIVLIGFDVTDRGGIHWYDRNEWPNANNPAASNFERWKRAFDASVPVLQRNGIEVVNTSQYSALKCFKYATLEATLGKWGL